MLAYLGYLGCAIVIAALIQPEQEDVTRELGVDEGTLGAIVAGVLIVGVALFTEEVFFRGFMFTDAPGAAVRARGAGPVADLGPLPLHRPRIVGVVLQLSIFGLWLCWLYERTGSLWPPVALHVANNAIAFAILT